MSSASAWPPLRPRLASASPPLRLHLASASPPPLSPSRSLPPTAFLSMILATLSAPASDSRRRTPPISSDPSTPRLKPWSPLSSLKDNLNAEVALGTVTNVKEACAWLGYTYLFIRMRLNPLAYGIGLDEIIADPYLSLKQRALVTDAARALDKAKMLRFDEKSGNFYCTELGRIASHFYIQYFSVETYNEMLRRHMNDSEVIVFLLRSFACIYQHSMFNRIFRHHITSSLVIIDLSFNSVSVLFLLVHTPNGVIRLLVIPHGSFNIIINVGLTFDSIHVIDMVARSSEFENIVVRDEEQNELEMLARTSCPLEVEGGASNKHGKISILIQAEDKVDLISVECNERIEALKQHFSTVIQNMVAKLQSLSLQSDFAGFNPFHGCPKLQFLWCFDHFLCDIGIDVHLWKFMITETKIFVYGM